MVPPIIYVLLFNLTYILAQGLPNEHIFHDAYVSDAKDSKLKNNSTKDALSSSIKIEEQHINNPAPFIIKVEGNPFPGNDDHRINDRQLETSNKASVDQNQNKPNNEALPNQKPSLNTKNDTKLDVKEPAVPEAGNNPVKQVKTNSTNSESKNLEKSSTLHPIRSNSKEDLMQSGALVRGFYVFVGLSVLVMMYFILRSYRLRHGSQPSTTVRKYGVTARRSDMEMRPLELDDDDDDTVFEINNQSINR